MQAQHTAAPLALLALYRTSPAGMRREFYWQARATPGRVAYAARTAARAVWHSWPAFCARYYAGETWRAMPGPWPVKLGLMALCVAIPGPQDELLLIAVTQALRMRKARQEAAR